MYLGLPEIVLNKNRREGRFFCVCNINPSLYLAATQCVFSWRLWRPRNVVLRNSHAQQRVFFTAPPCLVLRRHHGHVTSKVESLYKLFKVFFFKGYLSDCVVAVQQPAYATFLEPDFLPFSRGQGETDRAGKCKISGFI